MKNLFRGAFGLASSSAHIPERKSARQPLVALQLSSKASWTARDYGALTREGYQRNAIVYRCVRMISEGAASVPFCVRRHKGCEAGDPAARFLSRGNPMGTATEVLESFYGFLQVGGNAYFEAALVDGVPSALYALRPDRVSVVTGRDGWPRGYDYEAGGYKRRFTRDAATGRSAIHHMRLFHPASDGYGFSPLEAAAQAVDVHNEGGRWAKALLDNSARPSGALIYKGGDGMERLSDEAFDRLKSELEGQHSGARHAGRPMVLEGGLDWKAMSLTPADMDFIEARREAAREIALAFGVPPMLLGIPGDNTYANYKEANQAFWRQTIVPLVTKTARGMEGWLQPFFGEDLRITADLDAVPALSEERARLWQRLSEASFLSDAIDAIGIDAYFPLSDWRDGMAHRDAELADDVYDLTYLQSQMEGGEGYDYFYASRADRDVQNRTPITDGAVQKPWVYRYKDLRQWWSQPHYNRRGGHELITPTDWVPESKSIWLMEIGCPAIEKGANQPNVFFDAKSAQSNYPYYSDTSRDDLMQRRYLEAFISYWSEEVENNPQSSLYEGTMIDTDMINIWAWDARPFPDFPARENVWSDGENWQRGHWLSGRMGLVPLGDIVEDICAQSGLKDVDVSKVTGLVQGYRIDRPMTGLAALTPLSLTYGFNAIETATGLRFASIGTETSLSLTANDIMGDLSSSIEQIKATPEERLRDVRIHFIDAGNDYQLGLASARDRAAVTVRILDINAPIVVDKSFARLTADRVLDRQIQSDVLLNFQLSETRLDIEVGDLISLPENDELWQVETMEGLTAQRVQARRVGELSALPNRGAMPEVSAAPQWAAKPVLFAIDVPGDYSGPLVGVGLDPFAVTEVSGPQESVTLGSSAKIGALLSDLHIGPIGRWDVVNSVDVFLPRAFLSSLSDMDIYEGGNRFALETAAGWEVFQAAQAELIAPSTYRLSRLLRGQDGSDADMQDVIASGARLIWLGAGWKDLPIPDGFIGESVPLSAIAAGRQSDRLEHSYKATHLRPLSPVHVKIREQNGQIQISWIRRTRIGGDSWAGMDVPLGEEEERYRVQLWTDGVVVAEHETTVPMLTLASLQNAESVSISQASRAFGWGTAATLTL